MNVELLYFDGCANHELARVLLEDVLTGFGITSQIRQTKIADHADAQAKRFLGSPSIRIDGVDVDLSAVKNDHFGMMCRVYQNGDALIGIPPRDMIATAVTNAMRHNDSAGGAAIAAGSATAGVGAALSATLASVCCSGPIVAPIVVGLLGATGAAAAASFKPYTPYLFAVSIVALAWGFWSAYRTTPCGRLLQVSRAVLWVAAALWLASLAFTLYSFTNS